MPTESMFEELKRYVRFDSEDETRLRELSTLAEPHVESIVESFYARVVEHSEAVAVVRGGQEQISRLKRTLQAWLRSCLTGPWDEHYFEERARIGRVHVRIQLPQQYNFTAMALVRERLVLVALEDDAPDAVTAARVRAINRLLDLELAIILHTYSEDYRAQLQRRERLATFGQMTSTIGHELRNPLGVIESSAYLLRRKLGTEPALRRHVDKIRAQVSRSNRIIGSMLDIVRDRPPHVLPVAAPLLAERAAASLLEELGFGVELLIEPDLPRVLVDAAQIEQVLSNLLINAVEAIGAEGRVRLEVVPGRDGRVELRVSDSGPGVDATLIPRLFEPLVTTKDSGVGLGLAFCRKVVDAHGGELALAKPDDLGGARFIVRLPVAPL
ncbi:MAG: protoglobin domain-containing protein [Myxococcales bacterium]|nr:protoglobin domain-containing protein [Myxococcales bacterium]